MEFQINYLSFYVIQVDDNGEQLNKDYKYFQMIDAKEYEQNALKFFLDKVCPPLSF